MRKSGSAEPSVLLLAWRFAAERVHVSYRRYLRAYDREQRAETFARYLDTLETEEAAALALRKGVRHA